MQTQIIITPEQWWLVASIPEYNIVTQGKTMEELLYMVRDALDCFYK